MISKYHSKVGVNVGVISFFNLETMHTCQNKNRPGIISIRHSNKLLCSTFDLPNPTCVSVREVKGE